MKGLAIDISPERLRIETVSTEKALNVLTEAYLSYFYSDWEVADNQYITLQTALYLSDTT